MEARSWSRPFAPKLPPPDPFLHLRLRVDDVWLLESGEWVPIRDETTVGLWSILGYLRRHAPLLMGRDSEAREVDDADDYLASRPLVIAIDAELGARGEIETGKAL